MKTKETIGKLDESISIIEKQTLENKRQFEKLMSAEITQRYSIKQRIVLNSHKTCCTHAPNRTMYPVSVLIRQMCNTSSKLLFQSFMIVRPGLLVVMLNLNDILTLYIY